MIDTRNAPRAPRAPVRVMLRVKLRIRATNSCGNYLRNSVSELRWRICKAIARGSFMSYFFTRSWRKRLTVTGLEVAAI
jgi:hypothetical protein